VGIGIQPGLCLKNDGAPHYLTKDTTLRLWNFQPYEAILGIYSRFKVIGKGEADPADNYLN